MSNHFLGFSALLIAVSFALATLSACVTSEAVVQQDNDYWSKKSGDCEAVLKAPHAYDVDRLAECTKKWEMYRLVDEIPLEMRSMYAVAFSTVSHRSPIVYDRAVADAALARICIPRHPMDESGMVREVQPSSLQCTPVSETSIGGTSVASSNAYANLKRTVSIEEVSSKDESTSNTKNKNGDKRRNKKAYSEALSLYQEALDYNPYNVSAKYNHACMLAILGDNAGALQDLEELYSWDDDEAEMKLSKASSDEDFVSLREYPKFKLMTGYFRLVIVNGAGSFGDEQVQNIKAKLEDRKFAVAEIAKTPTPTLVPQIWYKVGFDAYANKIKNIIGNSKTVVSLNKDSNSMDDIVVVWGQPEAAQLNKTGQSAPKVQGTRAQSTGLGGKVGDALKSGQDALKSVNEAQGTAEAAKGTATSLGSFGK